MWHEPYREGTKRVNLEYYQKRITQVHSGDYYAEYGINNPRDDDPVEYLDIK